MSEERRMLDALVRMRLHSASSDTSATYDETPMSLSTTLATALSNPSLDDTPGRRKSSALSISHLTSATPVRTTNKPANPPRTIASQAVRDIARELDAVEARLSVYRQSRDAPTPTDTVMAPATQEPTPTTRENDVNGVTTPRAVAEEITTRQPRTQQAGDVGNEVENALATCDRLLHQAKRQASAASLTRSLRGSGSRGVISREASRTNNHSRRGKQTPPPATVDRSGAPSPSPPSSSSSPLSSSLIEDDSVLELEATARTMRELAAVSEREIKRDAAAVEEHSRLTRTAQLKELQRKFELKKKMALLQLREECEAETRTQIKQAVAAHEHAHTEAIKCVQDQLLKERDHILNQLLMKHQAETEDHVSRVHVRIQSETLTRKQQLELQLKQDLEGQLKQLDEDAAAELRRFEQKKRLELESEVLTRREHLASASLKAQETKTNELKRQLQNEYTTNEQEELTKLQKALAFGAQAQVQQLRRHMESAHEKKLAGMRAEAALALEDKLTDLKQVLTLAHSQESAKVEKELAQRHRVRVSDLHEELEASQRELIEQLTAQADAILQTELAAQRETLVAQNSSTLKALRETLARDQLVKLRQLETEMNAQCEDALNLLRQQEVARHHCELETKLDRLQHNKKRLLHEAMLLLTTDGGRPQSSESTVKLRLLAQHLPQELQAVVGRLATDFEELVAEQHVLVDKIGDAMGLYLSFKRQCTTMEREMNELRKTVEKLHTQLQAKDTLAKRLYDANAALLKKLGLDQPQA